MAKLKVAQDLIDLFYPIGTYYETSNMNFNPNIEWGGTWVEDTGGRVTLGSGSPSKNNDTSRGQIPDNCLDWFYSVGDKGGEFDHKLTVNEMPKHGHGLKKNVPYGIPYNNTGGARSTDAGGGPWYGESYNPFTVLETGGDSIHNTVQPYIVVKRWHRTA